jgi:hypothetical protein
MIYVKYYFFPSRYAWHVFSQLCISIQTIFSSSFFSYSLWITLLATCIFLRFIALNLKNQINNKYHKRIKIDSLHLHTLQPRFGFCNIADRYTCISPPPFTSFSPTTHFNFLYLNLSIILVKSCLLSSLLQR